MRRLCALFLAAAVSSLSAAEGPPRPRPYLFVLRDVHEYAREVEFQHRLFDAEGRSVDGDAFRAIVPLEKFPEMKGKE